MERFTKQTIVSILVVFLLFSLMVDSSTTGSAAVIQYGSCGDNLVYTLSDEGLLTISGSGKMNDYTFDNRAPWTGLVNSVVIKEGVTSIGDFAFYDQKDITNVVLSNSVTSIGDFGFAFCYGVDDIAIPENVTTIGVSAFTNCVNLQRIVIPEGVTTIPENCFSVCSKAASITIPENVIFIEKEAFLYCTSVEEITIPNNVSVIGRSAFQNCSSLKSVKIPRSVELIEETTFYECSALEHAYCDCGSYASTWEYWGEVEIQLVHEPVIEAGIEPTCTETGLTEGSHCEYCGEILSEPVVVPAMGHAWADATYEWSEDNSVVTAIRTCQHDATHTETESIFASFSLEKAPSESEMGETLYVGTFSNPVFTEQKKVVMDIPALNDLDMMYLPSGLMGINAEAFEGVACEGIIIPDGCIAIGARAFANCANLIFIKIPASVISVAGDAFDGSSHVRIERIEP